MVKNQAKKIITFFTGMKTPVLVAIPFLSGLAIGTIIPAITNQNYTGSPFDKAIAVSIFFLWGVSGWVIFLRGDFPLPPPFKSTKGFHVKMVGLFMVLISWGIAVLTLVRA